MAKLILLLFFALFVVRASTQNETMPADTALARQLADEAFRQSRQFLTIDSAIALAQQSLALYQRALGEQCREVGKAYHMLAIYHATKGQLEKAVEYDLKSLEVSRAVIGYNSPEVSNILLNLGQWYRGIDGEISLRYTEECLVLRKQLYGDIHPEVAAVYGNMALTFWERYDYEKAIACNLKFLSILEQSPEKDSLALSNGYTGLANIYGQLGQFDKLNPLYEKALTIRLAVLGEKNSLVARTYSNWGSFLLEQQRYSEALDCHDKALRIRREIMPPDHLDIATSYNNLGLALDAVGEVDSAIWCFQQALVIREKKMPDNPRTSGTWFNLAEAYTHKGRRDLAIEYYRKSFYSDLRNLDLAGPHCITVLQALLHALEQENRPEEIRDIFNQLELENSPLLYPVSLQGKIRLLQWKGHYFSSIYGTKDYSVEKSLEPYEEMDRLLSSDQYLSWSEDLREHFLNDIAQGYFSGAQACRAATAFTKDPAYLERAFRYSEKAKAFLLYGKLRDEAAKLTAGIPDSLLARERSLYEQIGYYETAIQQEQNKGAAVHDSVLAVWSGAVFDLKEHLALLKETLEKHYPRYYGLKYNLSTVDIPYLQTSLLQPDQALLEYFIGDSAILAIVVRRDTFFITDIPTDFPLDRWVKDLQHALGAFGNASVQSDRARNAVVNRYAETADSLYQKLILPVIGHLPSSLIIIPDGILGYIPFEALLANKPADPYFFKGLPYFVKSHNISYCYSATLLREMREKKHQHPPALPFLGFAPYYTGDTTLLANLYKNDAATRKDLAPLPNSGKELYTIQKHMGGKAWYGADATLSRFLEEAEEAAILHLATHARADSRVGDYAWLAFNEIPDDVQNELLFVRDLYNLSLNADLVVLSACETGTGPVLQGEGVISLARGFAYAGAKSILTTLWNVNDAQTTSLMIGFYDNLNKGMSKQQALWKAKLDYLKKADGEAAHPYYWGAFIGIGF